MMKKLIYLLVLLLSCLSINAQENTLYVMVDSTLQSLYKFKTKINLNDYYSSIKILKEEYVKSGFIESDNSNKNNDEIVIVTTQPTNTRYYEFESYNKPEIVNDIDVLKKYSISDISKNAEIFKEIWGNFNYSIVFIEKKNCHYLLWKMKPVYLE